MAARAPGLEAIQVNDVLGIVLNFHLILAWRQIEPGRYVPGWRLLIGDAVLIRHKQTSSRAVMLLTLESVPWVK